MSYHVAVSPDNQQSTHHVALTDGSRTVGLIVCDSKGAADPYNISMSPNQRSSLRTKSGTTKYEDLEEPWSATAQDDWSGGRASEDYETDTTKFFDSKRCQTAFKQIYNAPIDYYATGLKDSVTNWPGSVEWRTILSGHKYAYKITLTEPMQTGEVYVLLRRRGTPSEGLTVSLCQGAPENVIESHTYTTAEITDVISEWKKFTFPSRTLTAGVYWIMVTSLRGDTTNNWQIGVKRTGTAQTYVSRGNSGSWEVYSNYDLYFRLCAADTGRLSRFFVYKQLTFALTQTALGDPKLYVNGDIGLFTIFPEASEDESEEESEEEESSEVIIADPDPLKIIDESKNWTVNEWKGCRVGIIQGTGIEETVSVWRTIVANDASSLTVDRPWQISHDQTTCYIIYDTPKFYEIPAETHGLTGYVTDIIIANNIIFFAQGDSIPIRMMKWDGQWYSMDDEYEHYFMPAIDPDDPPGNDEDPRELVTVKNCAMYLQTVRDTSGLILWRGQNNDDHGQISISQSAVTDWRTEQITLADIEGTVIPSGKTEFFTDGIDFGKPDDISLLYKFTAGKITGTNGPTFTIYLQASEDNIIYENIKSVNLETSQEELYLACTTKRRWRRLHIVASAGSSPKMDSLKVETVAYSKFVTPITFNDSYGKITSLAEYPQMMQSQYKTLWINREGMIHSISSDNVVDTINLEELSQVMEEWNGKTSMVHNVYYYIRWMKGSIQRYYNQQLDSVGPDRDTGMPEERRGAIADLMAYPGRYFAAIDAGENGTSSVLLNNNSGFHEIYRAPNVGERITALGYQAISGDRPDRLWISVGDDIVWLVMPSNTLKAYYDDQAEYTHESVLVSSWYSIGMVDVIKQWGSMNVMAENLKEKSVYIEADYQIDQDPTWYPMSEDYTESPTQEVKFESNFGISAKRLRYRLRLQTTDCRKSPFVKAVVLKTVMKVGTKYNFGMSCRNVEHDVNLCGEVEDITPWQRLQTLMDWADNATALKMRCYTYPFDNRIVFLDPPAVVNLREKDRPGMLMTISMNEI